MSSLLDSCAAWEADYNVVPMSQIDRDILARWINTRIRLRSGRTDLEFPSGILPQTGLACYRYGRLLAVATIYLELTSHMAVCGWCAGEPAARRKEIHTAIDRLLAAMPDYAKSCGARFMMTTFGNRAINRMLDRMGFTPGETMESKFLKLV